MPSSAILTIPDIGASVAGASVTLGVSVASGTGVSGGGVGRSSKDESFESSVGKYPIISNAGVAAAVGSAVTAVDGSNIVCGFTNILYARTPPQISSGKRIARITKRMINPFFDFPCF